MAAETLGASPPRAPPKFDIYGWEIKGRDVPNTERVETKLPPGWSLEPSKMTQKTLLERRKRENIPDISFDLDCDGKVGGQDLVLGKLFDLDKDGRLNTSERKAADTAVASGLAEKYVWGVEQAAPTRPYRLIQKRGQIVDSEDFSAVAKTYPEKARSVSPIVKTYAELRDRRARERLDALQEKREQWEKRHPQQMLPETQEYRRTSVPYRTYSEKQSQEAREARLKAGLLPIRTDISDKPVPSLAYIPLPKYRSKSHMRTIKHEEKMQNLSDKQNQSFIDADRRLEMREEALAGGMRSGDAPGKTYSQVKAQIQNEAIQHNAEIFSTVKVGIHGKELPKFAENCQEYWKNTPDYVSTPAVNSLLELKQKTKYYAPRDVYKLADKDETEAPPDPFKAVHVPKLRIAETIPDKPTSHVPMPYQPRDLSDPSAPAPVKHTYRWTTLMQVFNTREGRGTEQRKKDHGHKSMILDESTKESESPGGVSYESIGLTRRKWATVGQRITKPISASVVRSCGFAS